MVCLLVLAACSSDVGLPPSDTTDPSLTTGSVLSCATPCVVFDDSRPFGRALSHPDSADAVMLGAMRVVGKRGSNVTLALEADDAWLVSIPATAQPEIEANGSRRSLSLRSLRRETEVLRLAGNVEIDLRIRLRREYDTLPTGHARLLLRTVDAQVRNAFLPWGATTASAAATADPGSCTFSQPGTYCGVTVGIEPVYSAGGNFQSQQGSGASAPMRITFSSPVANLRLRVNDPDFVGNRVIASAGGEIIVPGDNVPGTYTFFDVPSQTAASPP